MIDMEETKVKKLESIDFHTIALTSFDAYMMTTSGIIEQLLEDCVVSGIYIETEDPRKVTNQPIKDFIIGDSKKVKNDRNTKIFN